MTSIGPFPIRPLLIVAAFGVAWLVARLLAQLWVRRGGAVASGKLAGQQVYSALLVGLLSARLGHIARWYEDYWAAPWSILAIGDGGYATGFGWAAGLGFLVWRTHGQRDVRRLALCAALVGGLVWLSSSMVLDRAQRLAPPLPELALSTLAGQPVALHSLKGQPLVINLWATWCPPCRREMPAFAHAQSRFRDTRFVMVNQGETPAVVLSFLDDHGLAFEHGLLDPHSSSMRALGARGLPSTYFFDAQGSLVYAHMGELTLASISQILTTRLGRTASE